MEQVLDLRDTSRGPGQRHGRAAGVWSVAGGLVLGAPYGVRYAPLPRYPLCPWSVYGWCSRCSIGRFTHPPVTKNTIHP